MSIKTYLLRGRAKWAKITGPARPGYDNGPAEWSVDLVLDADEKAKALSYGVDAFYIKTDKEGDELIKFVRKAEKKDGTPGKPIDIVDHKNEAWDNRLIGNGSTLNICFTLNSVKSKGVQRLKPSVLSIQVWDLEVFKPKGPFGTKEDTQETTEEWDDK